MKTKLENWKIQQLVAKSQTDNKTDDMDTEEQPLMRSGTENFIDQLSEECIISPPDDAVTCQTVASFFHSQPNSDNNTLLHKDFSGQQQAVKGYEWIEMGVRRQEIGIFTEKTEKMVESVATKERGVAWNHSVQSTPILDHFNHITAPDPTRNNTSGPHLLLLGGYPDVDYPVDEDGSSQLSQPSDQPTVSSELSRVPVEGGISTKMDSDSQSMNQDTERNISSVNMETSPEAWSFSKNLKSPRLRKRRTIITHQGPSTQTSRPFTQDSRKVWSVSFSDVNPNTDRNSSSSEQTSDSRRSLTLGALKPNQELYWNAHEVDLDPQIFSESELPDLNPRDKWSKIKTQRSASIPNVSNEGGHQLNLHSRSLCTLPLERNSQFPISQLNTNGHHSPLEGLLERAKERVRDRDEFKRDRNVMSRYPPSSPSFSTTPSPSLSDGDRDTEWEEVALMRQRALTVSKGWKEQLVDGDEDERRGRSVGQSVLDFHMLYIITLTCSFD